MPLTVLRLGPEHEAAVLEMGMYVGGEIRELAAIGRPAIGVVTAVHGVHLSRIGSIDAVERAKGELVEALPAAADGGVAILNADDPRVRRMDARTRALPMTYGFADDADVRAVDLRSRARDGMAFRLLARGDAIEMTIPTLGRLSVHNALAGAAVGLAAGLDLATIAAALGGGWSAPHRGVLIDAGGVTIVDDSYNASPASVQAALELIGGFPGRHVAVLGEMKELGSGHDEGHRIAGEAAARGAAARRGGRRRTGRSGTRHRRGCGGDRRGGRHRGHRSRRGPRGAHRAAPAGRRGAREGVPRRGARPARRRARRAPRRHRR